MDTRWEGEVEALPRKVRTDILYVQLRPILTLITLRSSARRLTGLPNPPRATLSETFMRITRGDHTWKMIESKRAKWGGDCLYEMNFCPGFDRT